MGAALLGAGSAAASTSVGPATISGVVTWDAAGSPYVVGGNITVSGDLTVDPGVEVRFDGRFWIAVGGAIHVLGTPASPVTFAPNSTAAAPWAGLRLNYTANASQVRNASFDGALTALGLEYFGAPIDLSNITITNTTWAGVGATLWGIFDVLLDNVTVGGRCATGVAVNASSARATLRHVAVSNCTMGFYATGNVDATQANSVDGRPVLGIYNAPGTTISDASAYGWVYVWNSPNTSVSNIQVGAGAGWPAVGWFGSSGGWINGSSVRASDIGLLIDRSNDTRVRSSDIQTTAGYGPAVQITGSSGVTVDNTTVVSAGLGLYAHRSDALTVVGSSVSASYGILAEYGIGVTVRNSRVTGTGTYALTIYGEQARVEESWICAPLMNFSVVLYSQRSTARALSFCQGSGGIIASGPGTIVEDSTFDGVRIGVSVGWGVTVRWNVFRNCTIVGVRETGGGSTTLYENSFFCGLRSAWGPSSPPAAWFNASLRRGNFWDDYAGADVDGDFVGDVAYDVPGGDLQDIYPLVYPVERNSPAVTFSLPSSVNEDTPVVLNGSRSSDDSGALAGRWVIHELSGPVIVDGLAPTYTFATPGLVELEFLVWDPSWNNVTLHATITVLDTTPPWFPQGVGPFATNEDVAVNLAALVADNDRAFPAGASFTWNVSGRAQLEIAASTAAAEVNLSEPGLYTGRLTARDAAGNSASHDFMLTVRDRTPPTFDFVPPASPSPPLGAVLVFAMANATDNDLAFPQPAAFRWTVLVPGGGLVEGDSSSLVFAPYAPGLHQVEFEATDPSGNQRFGTWSFFANDLDPPLWVPPVGLSVVDGGSLDLTCANATDVSRVTEAVWYDGDIVISSSLAFTSEWSGPGDHPVRVVIADAVGNRANYSFTVRVLDIAPPHWLVPPLPGPQRAELGQPIVLDVAGDFVDNDPTFPATGTFEWSSPSADLLWVSRNSTGAVAWLNATGPLVIELDIRDAAGNLLHVSFDLVVRDSRPPTVSDWSVSPSTGGEVGTVFRFVANATDLSGVSFEWRFGDGRLGYGGAANHSYLDPGTYNVTLVAVDGAGNVAQRAFTVEVSPGLRGGTTGGGDAGPGAPQSAVFVLLAAAALAGGVALSFFLFRSRGRQE